MSSNQYHEIRDSRVFQRLPWRTETPRTLNASNFQLPPEVAAFKAALLNFENTDSEFRYFCSRLAPNDGPEDNDGDSNTLMDLFTTESPYKRPNRVRICSPIIQYLLLDTVSWQYGGPPNPDSPTIAKMPLPLMNHLPYPALENWTNLLVTAKAALDAQPTGGGAPDNDNSTPTLRHLRKMYQHNTNIHHMKILSNFEAASMHLRYLLEGNLDLPTKKADFIAYLQSQETSTPLTTIEQMIAPFEMAGLRLPLQAAMTLSPICLLANMALNIHAVAEDKLCRVWRCLGGNRPALLQVAELAIWNIIWDHSQNFIDLKARLQEALSTLIKAIAISPSLSREHNRRAIGWFDEKHLITTESDTPLRENSPNKVPAAEEGSQNKTRPVPAAEEEEEEEEEEEDDDSAVGRHDNQSTKGSRNALNGSSNTTTVGPPPPTEQSGSAPPAIDEPTATATLRAGGPSAREAGTQNSQYRQDQPSAANDHSDITTGRNSNEDRPEDNTPALARTEPDAGTSKDGNQPINRTAPATVVDEDVTMDDVGGFQATSAAADESLSPGKGKKKAQTKGPVRGAGADVQADTQGAEPGSENAAQSTNPGLVPEVRRSSRSKGTAKPQISASVEASRPGNRKGGSKRAGGHASKSLGKVSSSSRPSIVGPVNSTAVPPDHEVIDLTLEEDTYNSPPLNPIDSGQTKYPANAYQLWMPDGPLGPLHRPSFYFPEDVTWFNNMMDAAEDYYVDGKPRYVSAPSTSVFKILTEDEFENLSDKAVQETLLQQHIVVTGRKKPRFGFDLDGLESLAPLDKPIVIHDLSVPVKNDYGVRHTTGTLLDIYEASQSTNGKVLNSLDFPMQCAEHPPQSFATDVKAWNRTLKNCNRSEQYPTTSTRWGIVATSGAYHKWHVDTNGLGTYMDCQCGSKIWIVGRPKGMGKFSELAKKNTFQGDYDMDSPNTHLWDIEFVYLVPGTRLIMRPHTPHAVYTPDDAICHGGHYTSGSMTQDTCFGALHTFVSSSVITNTEHTSDAGRLCRRQTLFYFEAIRAQCKPQPMPIRGSHYDHVPDITTFKGILDILSICNLMEFSNILHPKMYGNALLHRERHAMIYGRLVARNLVEMVFCHYELVDEHDQAVDAQSHLVLPYLAQQAKCLLVYKAEAVENDMHSDDNNCSYKAVLRAVQTYCIKNTKFLHIFNSCEKFESFAWAGPTWGVRRRIKPSIPRGASNGHTYEDTVWLKKNPKPSRHDLPELILPEITSNKNSPKLKVDLKDKGPDEGEEGQEEDELDELNDDADQSPSAKRRRVK